jgi:hypothetical protein
MAGSAVRILHGFRAGSPVITDTGCCPSAARRRRPDLQNHNPNRPAHHPSCMTGRVDDLRFVEPPVTVGDRWRPCLTVAARTRGGLKKLGSVSAGSLLAVAQRRRPEPS